MNPPTLQRRTRHSYPHLWTQDHGSFAVGLLAIVLSTMSVIQFRFDEMTARQSLAIERRLASLSAAREPNRCPLRTAS